MGLLEAMSAEGAERSSASECVGPSGLKSLELVFSHALTDVAIEYQPFGPRLAKTANMPTAN